MLIKEFDLRSNLLKIFQAKNKKYKRITRLLKFFIVETRLNLTFSIKFAIYFAKNLSHTQIEAVKQFFKTLKTS